MKVNYDNLMVTQIDDFDNYLLYENGDVINVKLNKKVSVYKNKIQYTVVLTNNKKKKAFNILRLIYEKFYDVKLTTHEIIRLKNKNIDNKFHYTNLEKINRNNMHKNESHTELDKTKKWIKIKKYPDYKISNCGDIFSIKSNQMMKSTLDTHGYYKIKLINGSDRKQLFIHRLVYDTFEGIIDDKKVIDHIDRNKTNNEISNLREVSSSENSKNCERNKKTLMKICQYSLDGEFIKEWNSFKEIYDELGITCTNIVKCTVGKYKTSHGFIWKNPDIITDLSDFVSIDTKDCNVFSNYKISKKGMIINRNNSLLKPKINGSYYRIGLIADNGKSVNYYVHRLIGLTFLKNPNNYDIINHIDENKLNNDIANLEWVSHTQNITHSQGKQINKIEISSGKILKTYNSINEAARELGKGHGNIGKVLVGKRKSAYGFNWAYLN